MAMIRANRQLLLAALESVSAGLASKEMVQQGSCFVFSKGRIHTFNDEVSASIKSPIQLEGAIAAAPFVDLLSRLAEDEIGLEKADGEIRLFGKGKKAGVRMENDVLLPIDSVDIPTEWKPVPEGFAEAVSIVKSCASSEASQFVLTCIHIHPEYLEACDRFQISRYPVATGVESLVRAQSLAHMVSIGAQEICLTDSWVHFRNPSDLIMSFRRYLEDYQNLDGFLSQEDTEPIVLPGGLEDVVNKTSIFSKDNSRGDMVLVDLQHDTIIFEGRGATGWYKEKKNVAYSGPPVKFLIAPKLLLEVASKSNECRVGAGKLCITTQKFRYVTCTTVPDTGLTETVDGTHVEER